MQLDEPITAHDVANFVEILSDLAALGTRKDRTARTQSNSLAFRNRGQVPLQGGDALSGSVYVAAEGCAAHHGVNERDSVPHHVTQHADSEPEDRRVGGVAHHNWCGASSH